MAANYFINRKQLLTGTVQVNKVLLSRTVPVNNFLLTGTVQVNNSLLTRTVKKNQLSFFSLYCITRQQPAPRGMASQPLRTFERGLIRNYWLGQLWSIRIYWPEHYNPFNCMHIVQKILNFKVLKSVPVNKKLLTGTVPVSNLFLIHNS